MDRVTSPTGDLARRGFADPRRAAAVLAGWEDVRLVDAISTSAVPDAVLDHLDYLREIRPDALTALGDDPAWASRVVATMSASEQLARDLVHHPEALDRLRPGADAGLDRVRGAADPDELRLAYRAALLPIVADDVTADVPTDAFAPTAQRLADLADATLQGALALGYAECGDPDVRIGVVAMGKCGAQELNYVSDVDVIFVAAPGGDEGNEAAVAAATRVVAAMMRICSGSSGAGRIWQVDANLRPEGKAGPLVRTLDSMRRYYENWAKVWEFQALLKARPAAGDRELGREFVDLVQPMVWRVGDQPGFVADTQAMRRRVVSLLPANQVDREIKLGSGGLRDVEFTVQLLQLIHGRNDERVRTPRTLDGLSALVAAGYVGRADGAELAHAYEVLRTIEHRVQLLHMRRTHLLPEDPEARRRIGRQLDIDIETTWDQIRRHVLRLHQRLYYSPLLAAVAKIKTDELALTPEAAEARLRSLGYLDPVAAMRHIQALTSGLSRASEIQRQLMPAMLGWFAAAPAPDAGLLAFRQVSDALGTTPWYLRALRDEGAMAERFATLLATSRYCVDLIVRDPQAVQILATKQALQPRPLADLVAEMTAVAARYEAPEEAVAAIRTVRRRELFRLAAADILGEIDVEQVGRGVSDVTAATIEAALTACGEADPVRIGVVAMGRWGGREASYASDADVMYVVAEDADVQRATRVVTKVAKLLATPGPDPALGLDADLRPEGRNGPLVRSLPSYLAYYQRWSSPWEAQALLRADVGAGDRDLVEALLAAITPIRWPVGGPEPAAVVQMRRLKARMENERMPRGTEPARNVKLGPGGLSDVEWTVQLLQLRHADAEPALRTTDTLGALRSLVALELIDAADAEELEAAWLLASRARNAVMLVRGRPSDALPKASGDFAAVAHLLGYSRGETSTLTEDWLRTARRARAVVERLFWDD